MRVIEFDRRPTRVVPVGDATIGGDNPVLVQTMITSATSDIRAAAHEVISLHRAGAELVRITAPSLKDARHIGEIRELVSGAYTKVPLVADVHHQGSPIALEVTKHVDKVRINPGLFVNKKKTGRVDDYTPVEVEEQLDEIDKSLAPLIEACKDRGVAMRIGVNHGSLSERIMVMYGDTAEGMVQSALEYVRICEARDFQNLVISLKTSSPRSMVVANRLMAQRMDDLGMDYPLHLGVTEAGMDEEGRIKSTAGIATLLLEGIGDTLRVSLTENPINEISVCYDILQATGVRQTKVEHVSCPSCGRTKFAIQPATKRLKERTKHLSKGTLSVMGCIVNGPGEMPKVGYGYVGMGAGRVALYRDGKMVEGMGTIPEEEAEDVLIEQMKADGRWEELPEAAIDVFLEGSEKLLALPPSTS